MNTNSFLLLRLAIGASMLGHGLVRLPKLQTFSHWMVGSFAKSILPQALVIPFSYVLPIAEFIIGLLVITGLFTKPALMAGSLVMIILVFGTCMIENWEALPSQLIHVAFFTMLLQFISSNTWAIDQLLIKQN
ncbi:DoxX family protein [Mucilaginibacter lappiensis]|uniref:Thiosulfate dehydrogenase [quinone] large subunit n=1 Tax=Mucilaginibacter lappiensis TaxID=354630 RepID=A0A841JC33_9SPHI|nr:DoxX family membrane protein [Mucilaginibacter lappiensis]MBB6127902.1 thiosulfate dehydrogenase [quinone] large subunit [Mucilaginibacter lappiensis]